jgi:SAM-dependent methyltransferase
MLQSLPRCEAILDLGSGNRAVNDPRIIRADVCRTQHVDLVADAHALPFRDNSLSAVYATAVFEHLHSPWLAAKEIWRVLKPGGYALVDCNFVFPYHGYPAVYFNASIEGLRRLFKDFTELDALVAPWQAPSFALEAVLNEYLRLLGTEDPTKAPLINAVKEVLRFPLLEFDRDLPTKDVHRIAAAVSFIGMKQPTGSETILPPPLIAAWQADEALRQRYPNPNALIDLRNQKTDSLLHWSRTEGMAQRSIADWYASICEFRK